MLIGLISCSKSKLPHKAPARDLFSPSALFRGALAYLEGRADHIYVLSSEYGLLTLNQEVAPYDTDLRRMRVAQRRAWAQKVAQAILERHGPSLHGITFEMHAFFPYQEFLERLLIEAGAVCTSPVKGLTQGQRLAFYKRAGLPDVAAAAQPDAPAPARQPSAANLTIHAEIWLAAAMLHEAGHPTFSPARLAEEVERRFGDTRSGVMTHISAHCCASSPKNTAGVHNYLVRTDRGEYRLWRYGDLIHPSREGAPTFPDQVHVPEELWDLWRRWVQNTLKGHRPL